MPLKRRELVRKVGRFGGRENAKRGKGAHRLLERLDPDGQGTTLRYSLQFHGTNRDFPDSVVKAIRRKLKLTPENGVTDSDWDAA